VPKKDELVRFGVAMESSLLDAFDKVVRSRGSTRSELLRDLARAEITRAETEGGGADAVASLTLVYDHHVRDLTERLTELQHGLGDKVRAAMHVHLDRSHCLEVVALQGPSGELREFADRVFAIRGVKHGGIEIIATSKKKEGGLHVHLHSHGGGDHAHGDGHAEHAHAEHAHEHAHGHGHAHAHAHAHAHEHEHAHEHRHSHGHEHVQAKAVPAKGKAGAKKAATGSRGSRGRRPGGR